MAQNDTGVRVGRVSSINYQAGTARVVFGDKDSAVTKEVPFVSNNEYNMPLVGDLVQVSHNSNGHDGCHDTRQHLEPEQQAL